MDSNPGTEQMLQKNKDACCPQHWDESRMVEQVQAGHRETHLRALASTPQLLLQPPH